MSISKLTSETHFVMLIMYDYVELSKRESTGQQSGSRSDSKELIAKLRAVEKRLQFFLSWAKDYFHDLPPLILELDLCHGKYVDDYVSFVPFSYCAVLSDRNNI